MMYRFYTTPSSLDEALALKANYGADARFIAGATDLLIEFQRGARTNADGTLPGVIDLTRIPGLADIKEDVDGLHLGALVTHNQCVTSPAVVARAFPLARACWEVGAPQIRNRATVAGNLVTASPSNDTITPLTALDASVTLRSAARGERTLRLADFIIGFRRVDLADDELLLRINIPVLTTRSQGTFVKLGLRRTQAISVVSAAAVVARVDGTITDARLAYGAVAPVVVRATEAERFLRGLSLNERTAAKAADLAVNATAPIDDLRGSALYRREMVHTLTMRLLRTIEFGTERQGWPERPITLRGHTDGRWPVPPGAATTDSHWSLGSSTTALVNGRLVELKGQMTLLDSLRGAGFIGSKEGCAEGECGACTVFLDGMAVMACMVPSERAWGSRVETVEGLGNQAHLNPVQDALVQSGGVQCGYCTPGFVMSATKLLEECPHPSVAQAQEALTGNLCRCTGYRKILDAVVTAGASKK